MRIPAAAVLMIAAGFPDGHPELAAQRGARRPNFVLILADDLGYRDVASFGCPDTPTPNIDSIARDGVRLTDAYVTAPVCCPARAGLITGRYQQRFGHEFNPAGGNRSGGPSPALPLSQTLLAEPLKAAGYATGAIGKWHLGLGERHHPNDRGFDEFFGMASGHNYIDPQKPGVHHARLEAEPEETAGRARGILRNRTPVAEPEYLTEGFAREAVDFFGRHRREPFLLYFAPNAVHAPLMATDFFGLKLGIPVGPA